MKLRQIEAALRKWLKKVGDPRILAGVRRLKATREAALVHAAAIRRRTLNRTDFIGVTGSVGKTTTKELLVGILRRHHVGCGSTATENLSRHVASLILGVPRTDRFCVTEMGLYERGDFDKLIRIVRPRIGIVTTIGTDHVTEFGSREGIAQEKGKLVASLPADGIAVLNIDDPLVAGMRSRCAARIITYGLDPSADVHGSDATGTWPGRFAITVGHGGQEIRIQTQLCGTHWTPVVLAAVSGAIAYGVSLSDCARALADIPPYRARLQPVDGGNGIVFLRDDYKAPLGSFESVLHYMSSAAAARKVIVIGTVSDGARPDQKLVRLARRALEAADGVVFIGPWAAHMLRAAPPGREEAIRAFSSVRQANDYLKSTLSAGDLVLLKGTNRKDHLERIVLDRKSAVHCWRDDCGYMEFCSECRFLTVASGPNPWWRESDETSAAPDAPGPRERGGGEDALDVVVGLGNPGPEFEDTPHNLGRDAVNRLAARLNAAWTAHCNATVAQARVERGTLLLVKLGSKMNDSGTALRALAQARGFTPADCILIHDDLGLPLGSVRVKQRGSAGGHRGIAAILDVFQTDRFRRVKIGVGRPGLARADLVEYVLGKMPDADRAAAGKAAEEAAERALLLVEQRAKQPR